MSGVIDSGRTLRSGRLVLLHDSTMGREFPAPRGPCDLVVMSTRPSGPGPVLGRHLDPGPDLSLDAGPGPLLHRCRRNRHLR